jgi:hypothetical protein
MQAKSCLIMSWDNQMVKLSGIHTFKETAGIVTVTLSIVEHEVRIGTCVLFISISFYKDTVMGHETVKGPSSEYKGIPIYK